MIRFRSVVCLFMLLCVTQVARTELSSSESSLDIPLPNFLGVSVTGDDFCLSTLQGKVVLINFWGIWCRTCHQEIPQLIELHNKWSQRGLTIVGVNYGDTTADINDFITHKSIPYPVIQDHGLANELNVYVYPTTFLIDRSGRIRQREVGADLVFDAIEQLVNAAPPQDTKSTAPNNCTS